MSKCKKCKKCKDCKRYFREPHDLCYLAETEQVNDETEACERFVQVYDEDEHYTPSATHGDYSPSNPWDAPGMSISDFI